MRKNPAVSISTKDDGRFACPLLHKFRALIIARLYFGGMIMKISLILIAHVVVTASFGPRARELDLTNETFLLQKA